MDDLKAEIAEVFHLFDEEDSGVIHLNELASALHTITGETISREETLHMIQKYDKNDVGVIQLNDFEDLVMSRLKGRSFQEETTRAFKLLEDKELNGFITKESLRKAALSVGEKLSDAELADMFDALVTGNTKEQAVDFATFCSIQYAAEQDAQAQQDTITTPK